MRKLLDQTLNGVGWLFVVIVLGVVVYTGVRFWFFEVWTYRDPPVSEPTCPFWASNRPYCH